MLLSQGFKDIAGSFALKAAINQLPEKFGVRMYYLRPRGDLTSMVTAKEPVELTRLQLPDEKRKKNNISMNAALDLASACGPAAALRKVKAAIASAAPTDDKNKNKSKDKDSSSVPLHLLR